MQTTQSGPATPKRLPSSPDIQVQSPRSATFTDALCTDFYAESTQAPIEQAALKSGLYLLQTLTDTIKSRYETELRDERPKSSTRHTFGGLLGQDPGSSSDDEQSQSDEDQDGPASGPDNDTTSQDSSNDPLGAEVTRREEAAKEPTAQELVEANLHKLVLPMTDQIDTDALAQMRSRFCSRIQSLEMTISKDRKQQKKVTFDPFEVAHITNFFFSDMLGVKALRRVADLVQYYSADGDGASDKGLSSRARLLAEDSTTPEMLRAYYDHLHKATDRVDENRVFKHVQQVLRQLEFLKEHKHLKLLAQQKDPDLTAALKELGYTTRRGASLLTCLLDALSSSLAIPKTSISNIIQAHTGVEKLVELFGEGVILLLPPGAGRQLYDWGNQRMAFVYPILHDELKGLPEVCDYIRAQVLDPLRRGDPIPLAQIKTGTKMSLQQRIQEAIEEKSDGEPMPDGLEENVEPR